MNYPNGLPITLSSLILLQFFIPSFTYGSINEREAFFQYNNYLNVSSQNFNTYAKKLYGKLQLRNLTSLKTFKVALLGYLNLKHKGAIKRNGLLILIDYSRPSDRERFFVIDVKKAKLLYKSLVAHGKNSGDRFACGFSNKPGSYKSCLGFFVTGSTYKGKHGYSLLLQGVEPGINDNALKRRIVIHGADYVSRQFIKKYGRAGRSLGCPALPQNIAPSIIETIKGGNCLFIFGRDKFYFQKSRIINAKGAVEYFEKTGI